ncbi:hypothetical protein ES705_50996 [subsurface metagenome]
MISPVDSLLNELKIQPVRSVHQFREEVVEKADNTSAVVPELLLKELKENNVYYLINASLRLDRSKKSNLKINTVERYMIAINAKYPGIFKMVKQIGHNNQEPARLFYIDYQKYHLD